MNGFQLLIAVGLVHCALLFFNVIFVTCAHFPYIYFLKNTGLEIGFFKIKWSTTAFNKKLTKWGATSSRRWSYWFDLGVIACLIVMPLSVGIIINMSYNFIFAKNISPNDSSQSLQMMIPGLDFPIDQVGHYVLALLLGSIIHELGHAMAAVKEDVKLFNIGLSVMFILTVAFANICSNQLSMLSPRKQFRILCAGVWHNVVLTFFGLLILGLINFLSIPFYSNNSGVIVTSMAVNSPLLGPSGLKESDVIYKVNDCSILNNNDWHKCLLSALKQPNAGYCIDEEFIQNNNKNQPGSINHMIDIYCCDAEHDSNGYLCFTYRKELSKDKTLSCLPARLLLQNKLSYCQTNVDCQQINVVCIKPSVDNITKMVEIKREVGKDVLFIGYPADIYRSVMISDWIPKYSFINSEWPETLILLCKHLIIFSSGLAVINALPCFFFDGQYIFTILAHYLLDPLVGNRKALEIFIFSVKTFFSVLLFINIIYMILNKVS